MISQELEVKITHLAAEGEKVGAIARQLGVHHDTVLRCLGRSRKKETHDDHERTSVLGPWLPLIDSTLASHPKVRATRICSMLKKRGYTGSVYPVRRYCNKKRPRADKAFLDLQFLPGEFAQMDWASFGKIKVGGKHERKLHLFLMVLAYSRSLYGRFFYDMSTARVLEGHTLAFAYYGGCPRHCLYDNMKSAVIEHVGEGVRFNSDLLDLAKHYGFMPRACNPRSGWEKGRIERSVRYVRENFFEARQYNDLDDLNAQFEDWLKNESMERPWPEDQLLTVRDAAKHELLNPLPAETYDPYEEHQVRVDKKAMIQFDTNRYPVEPEHTGRSLILRASHSTVRVMTEATTLHTYTRLWTKHGIHREPWHQSEIAKVRKIKEHRAARSILEKSIACGHELLLRWSELDENIQNSSKHILELIRMYGAPQVETAAQLALENKTPRSCSIAQILAETNAEPKQQVRLRLSKDIPELTVEWPSTSDYDDLYS